MHARGRAHGAQDRDVLAREPVDKAASGPLRLGLRSALAERVGELGSVELAMVAGALLERAARPRRMRRSEGLGTVGFCQLRLGVVVNSGGLLQR